MIYVAEKSLKDVGDKAPKDVKAEVEKKIKSLKENLEKGTSEEIEQQTKDLSDALSKIGQNMYNQPGATPPKAGQTTDEKKAPGNDKKDVEEGEVVK